MNVALLRAALVALWQAVPIVASFAILALLRPISDVIEGALISVGVVLAIAVGLTAEQLRRRADRATAPDEFDLGDHAPRAEDVSAPAGRSGLVDACIEVADVVPSEALRQRLQAGLSTVGITSYAVDGVPFDPQLHHGVGTEETSDPSRVGVIAATERVGYRDADGVVRPPDVIVYRGGNR